MIQHYQDEIKAFGLPNDCVASIAIADFSVIATWRDKIQIELDMVREHAKKGVKINKKVVLLCPGKCIE